MKVAALFSGGKDSTYAIFKAKDQGYQIECLVTIIPHSEESMLLHFPNIKLTNLQAESMKLPQIIIEANSNDTSEEAKLLGKILGEAKSKFEIKGIVHGGILSEFQKKIFSEVCTTLDLEVISPLWKKDQVNYMNSLIDSQFH